MKKIVYIHIGSHKTGTTAIQTFLSANRKTLKKDGYLYPGGGIAHHDMAREFRTLSAPEIRKNPGLITNKYVDEINRSGLNKILLSSEGFELLTRQQIVSLKEFLPPEFHVKIIFYVRRQDEKIESSYNRSVKNLKARSCESFSEFVIKKTAGSRHDDSLKNDVMSSSLDYYSHLLRWSEVFGRENIIVRCYEEEQFPKGIYHDFLETIGLTLNDRYLIPKNRINESLSWDLIEVMRICNTQFKDDIDFHKFLLENFIKINSQNKNKKQHLLSPQQRRDIIALFEESNAKVAREYLGRSDGRLFYAPLPDLQEPWEPYEGLTLEKIVPIFTQMLFNIDDESKDRGLKRRMRKTIIKIGSKLGLLPAMQYLHARFHSS
jgi:hypothetical protein